MPPSFSRIREHTETLNKTERKREKRGEKPRLELIENARVPSHSINRHGWTVAHSSRPPRPFEFTSFPSLTSKGTHHPVIKGADNAKLSLESFPPSSRSKAFLFFLESIDTRRPRRGEEVQQPWLDLRSFFLEKFIVGLATVPLVSWCHVILARRRRAGNV